MLRALALPYTVKGRHMGGSRTAFYPDADWALRRLKQYQGYRYADIVVSGPDGEMVEADPVGAIATAKAARGRSDRPRPARRALLSTS